MDVFIYITRQPMGVKVIRTVFSGPGYQLAGIFKVVYQNLLLIIFGPC